MPNKYLSTPELEIDLHGFTTSESKAVLDSFFDEQKENKHKHVRIIVGKGLRSENGPVLPDFVRAYLNLRDGVRYNQAKIADGGEGALEVYLK